MSSLFIFALWWTCGIGAALCMAFSKKTLIRNILYSRHISYDMDAKLLRAFVFSMLAIPVGPFLWIYIIYEINKNLEQYIKEDEYEVEEKGGREKYVEWALDLREDKTS